MILYAVLSSASSERYILGDVFGDTIPNGTGVLASNFTDLL